MKLETPLSHPPDQSSTQNPRETELARKFKGQAFKTSPFWRWLLEFDGERAELTGPAGIAILHRILAAKDEAKEYVWTAGRHAIHDEVPVTYLAVSRDGATRQVVCDIDPVETKRFLTKLNKIISDPTASLTDRTRAREYRNAAYGSNGRKRYLADEDSRDQDAVRKQIERAVTAIKKTAPRCAAYLKANIASVGHGGWIFTGNRDEWDLASDLSAWDADESDSSLESQSDLDPDEIRRKWIANRTSTPRPVTWTPSRQNVRTSALRELEVRCAALKRAMLANYVWWEVSPDKSFGMNRPAYLSRGQQEGQEVTHEDPKESEDCEDAEASRQREGDDRKAEDFESER